MFCAELNRSYRLAASFAFESSPTTLVHQSHFPCPSSEFDPVGFNSRSKTNSTETSHPNPPHPVRRPTISTGTDIHMDTGIVRIVTVTDTDTGTVHTCSARHQPHAHQRRDSQQVLLTLLPLTITAVAMAMAMALALEEEVMEAPTLAHQAAHTNSPARTKYTKSYAMSRCSRRI